METIAPEVATDVEISPAVVPASAVVVVVVSFGSLELPVSFETFVEIAGNPARKNAKHCCASSSCSNTTNPYPLCAAVEIPDDG